MNKMKNIIKQFIKKLFKKNKTYKEDISYGLESIEIMCNQNSYDSVMQIYSQLSERHYKEYIQMVEEAKAKGFIELKNIDVKIVLDDKTFATFTSKRLNETFPDKKFRVEKRKDYMGGFNYFVVDENDIHYASNTRLYEPTWFVAHQSMKQYIKNNE